MKQKIEHKRIKDLKNAIPLKTYGLFCQEPLFLKLFKKEQDLNECKLVENLVK
ncbi:MAG: hypothetical protein ACRC1W_09710 [Shewanella sp.]